jgi:hypothetical protein
MSILPVALVGIAGALLFVVRKYVIEHTGQPVPDEAPEPPEADPATIEEALDDLWHDSPVKLNDWRKSIVDFLKLLHQPADQKARNDLWESLRRDQQVPSETYRGSGEQNVKLIKAVFDRLRAGGMALPAGG